jgi:membrane-associated phospholipid phosphatase
MELNIIKAIQQLRTPFFDWFFYIITEFGDQTVLIVLLAIIYWTMSKKYAHRFLMAFLLSALVNISLKELFMRPRPFELGIEPPKLPLIGEIKTHGYAFPSGHANTAGAMGYVGIETSKRYHLKWLFYISVLMMFLIPISRVYLAQHYISDIVVGLALGFMITFVIMTYFTNDKNQEHLITLFAAVFVLIALIFVRHPDFVIAAGGFIGFAFGYTIEKKYVKLNVNQTLRNQVFKVIIGIVVILLFKEGLKLIFPDTLFFDFVRYFVIGVWVTLGAPIVFKNVFKSHS